jgi:hypothetical protein
VEWKYSTLRFLGKLSTFRRITSVMLKRYAHNRKHFNPHAKEIRAPVGELSKHKFVAELWAMDKRAITEDYEFAGAPVLFQKSR